jgi:hypothetical protein
VIPEVFSERMADFNEHRTIDVPRTASKHAHVPVKAIEEVEQDPSRVANRRLSGRTEDVRLPLFRR